MKEGDNSGENGKLPILTLALKFQDPSKILVPEKPRGSVSQQSSKFKFSEVNITPVIYSLLSWHLVKSIKNITLIIIFNNLRDSCDLKVYIYRNLHICLLFIDCGPKNNYKCTLCEIMCYRFGGFFLVIIKKKGKIIFSAFNQGLLGRRIFEELWDTWSDNT